MGMEGCTAPLYFEMDSYAPPDFADYINNILQMKVQNQIAIKAIYFCFQIPNSPSDSLKIFRLDQEQKIWKLQQVQQDLLDLTIKMEAKLKWEMQPQLALQKRVSVSKICVETQRKMMIQQINRVKSGYKQCIYKFFCSGHMLTMLSFEATLWHKTLIC